MHSEILKKTTRVIASTDYKVRPDAQESNTPYISRSASISRTSFRDRSRPGPNPDRAGDCRFRRKMASARRSRSPILKPLPCICHQTICLLSTRALLPYSPEHPIRVPLSHLLHSLGSHTVVFRDLCVRPWPRGAMLHGTWLSGSQALPVLGELSQVWEDGAALILA